MIDWIFLSKDGEDEYINMFAKGCNSSVISTDNFIYEASNEPIVLRGIMKHKIMKQCWKDARTFYYMDSGYFGNQPNPLNPQGWKVWHRIVKNNLQHDTIIARPDDRWQRLKQKIEPWKRNGRKILIATPDEKPCKFYGIDLETWISDTVDAVKQFTDRPIEIRTRSPNRIDRIQNSTLKQALDNDVFALVTYNSNAATEAIMYGYPTFTLAPTNAASPVSLQDISKINEPYYPDQDKLYAWACHLAYGQFHNDELKNGYAKQILENQ